MRNKTQYQRHDLLWLSGEGKEYALQNVKSCIPVVPEGNLRPLASVGVPEIEIKGVIFSDPPIPAIITRQETRNTNTLDIGFSSPRIIDGVRLRISSKVPQNYVVGHKTPFDIVTKNNLNSPFYYALKALIEAGNRNNIQVGCFGSAALQMVTGLPYMQRNSDLDIYLRYKGNWQELEPFLQQILSIEKKFGIIIDAEIEYFTQNNPETYGVKLKELLDLGKTVLGKGLYDVILLEKRITQ